MTARDEARAALAEYEKHGGIATVSKDLAAALRALLDEPVPAEEPKPGAVATDAMTGLAPGHPVDPEIVHELIASAIEADRAAGFRRQGPVTDDTEWEYADFYPDGSIATGAEAWAYYGPLIKKHRRKAGPWEPVGPEETTR